MNNFDKNTLGDSPAAIYIIDLLNEIERKKAIHIIKSYGDFKETFKELMDAHAEGFLSARVVRKYIETHRSTLPLTKAVLTEKGYDLKIINLYQNLVIAELKKAIRKLDAIKKLEISAIARAKSGLKVSGSPLENQQVATFGKFEGKEIPVDVKFNQHGMVTSFININHIEDKITSETLMKKSEKRIARKTFVE